MAVYMQGSRRRWISVAVGVVALLIGVGIGYLVGRGTATTADDVVTESRTKGEDAATALQRLPIEYEQALTNASGESPTTVTDALDDATSLLTEAYAASPWLPDALRQPPVQAIGRLKADVTTQVAADVFAQDVAQAVDAIGTAFNFEAANS